MTPPYTNHQIDLIELRTVPTNMANLLDTYRGVLQLPGHGHVMPFEYALTAPTHMSPHWPDPLNSTPTALITELYPLHLTALSRLASSLISAPWMLSEPCTVNLTAMTLNMAL